MTRAKRAERPCFLATTLQRLANPASLPPVIVLGEYRLGIAQSRYQKEYESWLREWIATVTVIEISEETTFHYSVIGLRLKGIGKPIPSNDLWIAALFRQHCLSLLSRDRHFDVVSGLQRIDW